MRQFVTVTILIAALFMILSRRFDPSALNFAYFAVGSILAYWLAAPERPNQ